MNVLSSLLYWIGNTIGADPNDLTTESKTIVGAINEVNSKADATSANVYTKDDFIIIEGQITSVAAHSWKMDSPYLPLGVAANDVAVISLHYRKSGSDTWECLHYFAMITSGSSNHYQVYPYCRIAERDNDEDRALAAITIYNDGSTAQSYDYRVVLLKIR